MALYNLIEETATLHISKGNNKIGSGIWSYSTLPGNADHMLYIKDKTGKSTKIQLTDIPGTCSKYCEGCARDGACYAWRDAKLHHNVTIKAWGENTLLKRSGKIWNMIKEFLDQKNKAAAKIIMEHDKWMKKCGDKTLVESKEGYWENVIKQAREKARVKYFRIHVSGEVENSDELHQWAEIAAAHPETIFGIYTKNYDALGEFLDQTAAATKTLPQNLVINVSEWHGVAKDFIETYQAKYPEAFNVFEYDDTNKKDCDIKDEDRERLSHTPHCPAVNQQGHHATAPDGTPITCDLCKRCYKKTGLRTAVWSH